MTKLRGKVPNVGDELHLQDGTGQVLKITEVGNEIRDPNTDFFGAAVLCEDDVWYDCFWSFKNNRFQYFNDDAIESQE